MSRDAQDNVEFYSKLYQQYGDAVQSLNWGSRESQRRRFAVLAAIAPLNGCRVLDVGCGLADFLEWLRDEGMRVDYTGIELTPAFAERVRQRFPDVRIECGDFSALTAAAGSFDYVIASGIFYLRKSDPWKYMTDSIASMFDLAARGVAFNSLSTWRGKLEPGEFYADPLRVLEFCRTLSPRVVLRHDYHPGDFSVYLYKGPAE